MASPAAGESIDDPASRSAGFRPWAPAVGLIAAVAAVYLSGAWRYLSLATLQAHAQELKALVALHPAGALLLFVATYALVVVASIPGAIVLTLAGGFLFGVWEGALATIVGASLGATGIYLLARSILAEPLARRAARFGGRLSQLNDGFRRDAFFYLLSLRLIPAVPFWLVNIAAGLARAPVRAYVGATILGMAPATFVYSATGAGLDRLFAAGARPSFSLVLQPRLLLPLLGLAALSLLPVAVRRIRARRAPADA